MGYSKKRSMPHPQKKLKSKECLKNVLNSYRMPGHSKGVLQSSSVGGWGMDLFWENPIFKIVLYHSYGRLSILRNLIFPPPYSKTLNKLDYLHCCAYTRHKGIIIQLVRPTENLKAQNFFLRRTCSFNCSINRKSV